ncbi:MAG: hypothetical protein EOO88_13705 [Pedobacter sp.]|nr:MAG: hypothetical protein EOO88_13705 [Pedobacter sp.]
MKFILPVIALVFLCSPSLLSAQKGLQLKNVGVGYSVAELDLVGNNPYTVIFLMKSPGAYHSYINNYQFDETYGNPGIFNLRFLNLTAEFHKPASDSRFWRKFTVEAGISVSNRIHESAGALQHNTYETTPEYVHRYEKFSLVRNQRFAAVNFTLYRKLRLGERLTGSVGVRYQPGLLITNKYEASWDTAVYSASAGLRSSVTTLPDFQGKRYFQTQLMLPIGIEWQVVPSRLAFRLQLTPGVLYHKYKRNEFAASELHSAGVTVLYSPARKRKG